MSTASQTTNEPQELYSEESRGVRKDRLLAIVDKGLPPFPAIILKLTTALSGAEPDIKKAAKLIRSDASLSSQVLRLCNSPMFGLRSRVISIEQAAVLVGAERLRSLAMTCSLLAFAGNALPQEQLSSFWSHSFLTALLVEQLAVHQDYFEKEQAYIAGLLHDIGRLPQYMLVMEAKEEHFGPPVGWDADLAIENTYFGMNHCALGGLMARSWNFMPSFVDALENHHNPAEAQHDPALVDIVAAVEQFLFVKHGAESFSVDHSDTVAGKPEPPDSPAYEGFHLLNEPTILEMLNAEYNRLLPLLKAGLPVLGESEA